MIPDPKEFVKSSLKPVFHCTRKNAQVVTDLEISCYKSVHKLSTSCIRTACSQFLRQVWNKLLTTCNKLDGREVVYRIPVRRK
jgi:hypothetical protein